MLESIKLSLNNYN